MSRFGHDVKGEGDQSRDQILVAGVASSPYFLSWLDDQSILLLKGLLRLLC